MNLSTGETGFLPDGVTLRSFSREGDDVALTFRVRTGPMTSFNPFSSWRNPGGEEEYFGSWSGTMARDDAEDGGPGQVWENYSDISFTLQGCTEDRVELKLDYTRWLEYGEPIEVPIS